MSQLSKVTYSRHQWKHKATQRGDRDRYRRQQIARISAERDRSTTALQAAQARLRQLEAPLRQLEAPLPGQVTPPKVEVVLVSLQLF
jgi:multidrug resistance efflux pump